MFTAPLESPLASADVALLTAAAAALLLAAKEILLRRWMKQALDNSPASRSDRSINLTKMSGSQTRGTEPTPASQPSG